MLWHAGEVYFANYLWLRKQKKITLFLKRFLVAIQDGHSQQVFVFPASEFSKFPGRELILHLVRKK